MNIRIVSYEEVNAWILGKFARKLAEEIEKTGNHADISDVPDPLADINHHIIYYNYDGKKSSIDTVMVTHIDSFKKKNQLRMQLESAEMGICMSSETALHLVASGLPKHKICYINPAHDGLIQQKKAHIGITSKMYIDGRKKENDIFVLANALSIEDYTFTIMGTGWTEIVEKIRNLGFEITYYDRFDYETYVKLMPTLDYYLYIGHDEGSMGFMDAIAAGVATVVTPQGYHLDAFGGITHPINDIYDAIKVFHALADKKKKFVQSVSLWTWENYAKKHLYIWEYLLKNRDPKFKLSHQSAFTDGLKSIELQQKVLFINKVRYIRKLVVSSIEYGMRDFKRTFSFKAFVGQFVPRIIKNKYKKHKK